MSVAAMRALALALRSCNPQWPGQQNSAPRRVMAKPEREAPGPIRCKVCKEEKAPDEFHVTGRALYGGQRYRRRTCKECRNGVRRKRVA